MNVNRFNESQKALRLERLEKRRTLRTNALIEKLRDTSEKSKEKEWKKQELEADKVKARFDASTTAAMSKKEEENEFAKQKHAEAEARHRVPEMEEFHLTPENCNHGCRFTVVLPVPHGKRWEADRIAFFQSSATSNGAAFRHLRNTFLPTLGVANNGECIKNMDKVEGDDDVIVKTGLFKSIFCGKTEPVLGQETIPEWIYLLITEYCSIHYPTLLTRDYTRIIVNREDYDESNTLLLQFEEIYKIVHLLIHYFSDVWQIAMSIGLSRMYGCGVWVADGEHDVVGATSVYAIKFINFANFIDEKFLYTILGDRDVPVPSIPDRVFLSSRGAQSAFHCTPLPTVTVRGSLLYLFTGRSHALEIAIRSFKSINRLGGKSVKTRRQKRR